MKVVNLGEKTKLLDNLLMKLWGCTHVIVLRQLSNQVFRQAQDKLKSKSGAAFAFKDDIKDRFEKIFGIGRIWLLYFFFQILFF